MNKKEVAAVLRAVADWLDRASTEQVDSIVEGRMRFTLEDNTHYLERRSSEALLSQGKIELERVRQRLALAGTIEEGLQILKEEGIDKRKRPLLELARSYEVGVGDSDRIADISYRIISAVVGSKLQSDTMRSLNLDIGLRKTSDD